MGGKQRMAKADLARLVLLCADDLDGELKQARRQIPRRGKGKVAGHIKRPVNVQHKAVWREACGNDLVAQLVGLRSEEHTSELQSLMRISYAVFCLQKKTSHNLITINPHRSSYVHRCQTVYTSNTHVKIMN